MNYQNSLTPKDWAAMFDSVTDIVLILAPDHSILMCNKAARDALNQPLDKIIGHRCYHLVHNTNCPIKECPCEITLITKSPNFTEYVSTGRYYLLTAWPIFNDSGDIKAMIHSVRDITEKKQSELELIRAKEKAEESDRLKTVFLLNLSHEIRTPMNGILGFSQLLKEPLLTQEQQHKFIKNIEKSSKRMLNIISALVNISKIESGQMEVSLSDVDFNEQLDTVYHEFKNEVAIKGLNFSIKSNLSSDDAVIQTDKDKVLSVLNNLVDNAIKFTIKGSIEIGCSKKGAFIEFFVADSGEGIEEEKLSIIFERFRQGSESLTRNYEGAGLGLSIAKSYVELLGGKIWFESSPGTGSTFYFTLPITSAAKPDAEESVPRSDDVLDKCVNNLKVLIVEDDESSADFLSIILKPLTRELLVAHTGTEAMDLFTRNPDVDIILMDIKLPEIDGVEVIRKIRKINQWVIIIAQTAYDKFADKESAKEAGCDDFISKPIDRKLLVALMNKYLKRKAPY